jgi:ribose transport system permease protein
MGDATASPGSRNATSSGAWQSGVAAASWLGRGTVGPVIGLILLCVVITCSTSSFLTTSNILNILDQATVLGILSVGMTFVILIGGIDLSVGSLLALSSMLMGWLNSVMGVPLVIAIVAGIAAAAFCGLITGCLVVQTKLPPFIATLAMMSAARGVANLITGGSQITGYDAWFDGLSINRYGGVLSVTVGTFLLLAFVSWILLTYRATGRNLYAIGGNPEVARLSGIDVRKYATLVYVAAGACAGIAGIALASRLDSSEPSAGLGYELDTIAAVVIGGGSLSGGVGTIGGTVIGVLIIGVLHNGLNLIGVSPFTQQIVIGVVIALAVMVDQLRRRRS